MAPKIVIAAGGTAGHVVPALAIADALRADHGAEVVFIGGDRDERELVPAAGYELRTLRVQGLSRTSLVKAAAAGFRAIGAVLAARRLLREIRPDAVLGAGGYMAGVVGAAALLTRTPLVLTEADSHLGLSNRLLARGARKVCLAFELPGRRPPRYRVTGRPVDAPFTDRATARERFGIRAGQRCVLVFGGSIGSRSINEAAIAAFADAQFAVIHVTGRRDFAGLRPAVDRDDYQLHEYISPFGPVLAAADLVVARAGGSVFEIAAHGLPAVLVPYPSAAGDHQTANARHFERAGAAVVLPDADLTPARLRETVDELLGDGERMCRMAGAALSMARPDAASEIAAEIVDAAR